MFSTFLLVLATAAVDRAGIISRTALLAFFGTGAVLLIPHIVAALIFATERTLSRILALVGIHTTMVAGILSLHFLDFLPVLPIVAFIAFVTLVFITRAVYKTSALTAFLLMVSVNLLSVGAGKVVTHFIRGTQLDQRVAAWIVGVESPELTRVDPPVPRTFANVAEAQTAAIARYPDLGKAGTALHTRFLQEYTRLQREDPARLRTNHWPWELACQVAGELQIP